MIHIRKNILKGVLAIIGTVILMYAGAAFLMHKRMASSCASLEYIAESLEAKRYFYDWFDNFQPSDDLISYLQGMASIDPLVSPETFDSLNLDLTKLGLSKNVIISFNRDINDWNRKFNKADVKSVSIKPGRNEILFLVNDSKEFGQLEWRVNRNMIDKVNDQIYIVCDES